VSMYLYNAGCEAGYEAGVEAERQRIVALIEEAIHIHPQERDREVLDAVLKAIQEDDNVA
jgi:hypothetical protein